MNKDDLKVLENEQIPESIRTMIAKQNLAKAGESNAHKLALKQLEIERRKAYVNTPIYAALAGLITLTATFVFDIGTKQTEADITEAAKERDFQYEILSKELARLTKPLDRAASLEFLARAGVLTSLNTSELKKMAQEQRDNPEKNIVPQVTPITTNAFDVGTTGLPVSDLSEANGQVALLRAGTRDFFCNGLAVGPTWILTTAHCVDNSYAGQASEKIEVLAGTLSLNEGGETYSVKRIVLHPEWDSKNQNFDAALLELTKPINRYSGVKLAESQYSLPPGSYLKVTGWGAIQDGGPLHQRIQGVVVPSVGRQDCNKPASYDGQITESMVCAGHRSGGIDGCQGFSGSPARMSVAEQELVVGISSWGFGCGRPEKFGVYTSVAAIRDWVDQTIRSSEGKDAKQ